MLCERIVTGMGRDLRAAGAELHWPNGMTTAELDTAELEPWERERVADLIRKGVSLAPYYRDQLRTRGRSWLGIPRAEQTPHRMARVLVLLARADLEVKKMKAGYTFRAPCSERIGGPCYLDGYHTHIYELRIV